MAITNTRQGANSPTNLSERLHVILFRGADSAKTFEFSAVSLYRLIFGVLALGLLSIGLLFGFTHYYLKARLSAPASGVRALTPAQAPSLPLNEKTETELSNSASTLIPDNRMSELEAENARLRETLAQGKTQAPGMVETQGSLPFSAFGSALKALPKEEVPIIISTPEISWSSKGATVKFNIQYVGPKQGPQTGRILVLARGSSHFSIYPSASLSPAVNPLSPHSLIRMEAGETFSVSRFRQVVATFNQIQKSQIQNFEVLLIDSSNQILIHQIASASIAASQPAAVSTSTNASSTATLKQIPVPIQKTLPETKPQTQVPQPATPSPEL